MPCLVLRPYRTATVRESVFGSFVPQRNHRILYRQLNTVTFAGTAKGNGDYGNGGETGSPANIRRAANLGVRS